MASLTLRYGINLKNIISCNPLKIQRLLNYNAICYDPKTDPAEFFLNKDVQNLLKSLTRINYEKVFRRRQLGSKTLSDPEYKFMTEEELQKSLKEAEERAEELLQIPPVVKLRNTEQKVLAKDPALQGLQTTRLVFTDITFGIKDLDRIIVVREPDGTLQEAEWDLRQRMNQVYFPDQRRSIKTPQMFDGEYLEGLLNRQEYEYVLDRACVHFEPHTPEYQRVVSITYQHLNDNNRFDLLRSTRHFGALTFFLVWNKNIDNLLLELIETVHIDEASDLVKLYSIIHKIDYEGENNNKPLELIENFVKKSANKKGALELAVQAYKDVTDENRNNVIMRQNV